MAYVITSPEYVEIDGMPLSTPAWTTTQMDDLWGSPDVRGSDVLMPGAIGVRPHRRRPTVTPATIELAVVGDLAPDGTPYSSTRAGLATNCDLLRHLTGSDGVAEDGTRQATLHLAPGSPVTTRAGRVHVLRLRIARNGDNLAVAQLELSIPAGALT